MCGIAGLFLKNKALEPELGNLTATMLSFLSDRGPDSAGFAIYGAGTPGNMKLTLRGPAHYDFPALAAGLGVSYSLHDDHAVFTLPQARETEIRAVSQPAPKSPSSPPV